MKTVLWISRHEMTAAQRQDLDRALGSPVLLRPWRDTVRDLTALKPEIDRADVIAAVLPPELLAELLALAAGKPVLRAVSSREPTGKLRLSPAGTPEPEFAFVHLFWEQILRIEIRTRRL